MRRCADSADAGKRFDWCSLLWTSLPTFSQALELYCMRSDFLDLKIKRGGERGGAGETGRMEGKKRNVYGQEARVQEVVFGMLLAYFN